MAKRVHPLAEVQYQRDTADSRRLSLRNNSWLSEDDIRAIRVDPRHYLEIAAQYGIKKDAKNCISRIKTGKSYAWVPDDPSMARQVPLLVDIGVSMRELDRFASAFILQVDVHAKHGEKGCIITDLDVKARNDRPWTKYGDCEVSVARLICAVVHDIDHLRTEKWHTRHKCDNPLCVNPQHLEPGTPQENCDDRVKRGRSAKCERHGGAKLTESEAQWPRRAARAPRLAVTTTHRNSHQRSQYIQAYADDEPQAQQATSQQHRQLKARLTFDVFLHEHVFCQIAGIKPQTLRQARYRARKAGKPDPIGARRVSPCRVIISVRAALTWLESTGRYQSMLRLAEWLDMQERMAKRDMYVPRSA